MEKEKKNPKPSDVTDSRGDKKNYSVRVYEDFLIEHSSCFSRCDDCDSFIGSAFNFCCNCGKEIPKDKFK